MTFEERVEFLVQSIESHDRQLGELTSNVAKLVEVTNRGADAIRTLARIADTHDQRLRGLEAKEHRQKIQPTFSVGGS